MTSPEPRNVWPEVLIWLRLAGADQQVARSCMALDPPSRDVAAFHCQQAAEKLLKGILVQARVDFSGVHDLEQLGEAACLHLPSVAPLVPAMDGWTEWNSADSSSDMAADPGSGPSADELSRALDVIAQLDAALRSLAPPGSAAPL